MMKGKKSHLKGVLLLLVLLFISLPLSAQDLSVRSFEQVANDATAMDEKYQRLDGNQNLAGLVKVIIPREGVEFDGGMVIDQKKWAMGEYWVWMADGATKLNVRVPGFHALEVNFRDYDFKMLHSKNTYKLVVNVPVFGAQSQDDGMGYLALTVEPKSATLTVNGQQHTTTNGEVTVLLPMGSYDYEVSSPNFTPQKGRVAIDGGTKQLNIRLTSSSAQLKVSCATSSAKIYVNEQFKGTGSWQGEVSPGYYKVEARLDGYRINSQTLELAASDNRSVNIPALEKLTGALNVNYSPIGSDVYVDGSKVGTTPGIFRNIALGSHKVEIRKDGYTTASMTATVKDNETAELKGSLTANTNSNINQAVVNNTPSGSEMTPAQMNVLGNDYFDGKNGKPQDYAEAVKWYRKSAEQGNAGGQYNLGYMYQYGYGVEKDHNEAVKWYRKSAEQGYSYGQSSLGNMYRYGEGVEQDYTEAVKWYRKSALQGNAFAQFWLGNMYENGYGVSRDYAEAVNWYRKSAEQGNDYGQYNLGYMYHNGYGVEKDLTQAKYWYEKAAGQGNKKAKENLQLLNGE